MRLFLLLVACSPLVMGACPRILEGIERSWFDDFDGREVAKALDAACGRKNFSAIFWDIGLKDEVMNYVARDTIRGNSSHCNASCVQELDTIHHASVLKPLVRSLREAFAAMENAEAKEYIDATYAHKLKYRMKSLSFRGNLTLTLEELYGSLGFIVSRMNKTFSTEAQVAYAQAMKRGFGLVETAEIKRYRIETAMNALEHTVAGREDKEIAALIGQLQKLTNGTLWFFQFAISMNYGRNGYAEWIRPVAVVPAIELLYLQYRTLTNKEAKEFVDSFLASWKEHYERPDSKKMGEVNGRMVKNSFDSLSEETSAYLTTAFPELFAYLLKHRYIAKKSLGIF